MIMIHGTQTKIPTKVENNCVNDNRNVNKHANPAPGKPETEK